MLRKIIIILSICSVIYAGAKPDFYNFLGKKESYLLSQRGKPSLTKALKGSIGYIYKDNEYETTSFAIQNGIVKAVIKSYTDKTHPACTTSRTKFINYCIMKGFNKTSDNNGSTIYKLGEINIIISPVSPNSGSGFSFQAVAM